MNFVYNAVTTNFKLEEITSENLKDIKSSSKLELGEIYYDISLILCNEVFTEESEGETAFIIIYGEASKQFNSIDPYLNPRLLTSEKIGEIVEWINELHLKKFNDYEKYYNELKEDVRQEIEEITDLSKEQQFEIILKLFNFYLDAYKNNQIVIIHTQ